MDVFFKNLVTAPSAPAASTNRTKRSDAGTANAARVSQGSQHDVWDGLTAKDPKRHPSEHLTVTCVIYNTIAGGVPSEADVMAAVEDMEYLYESCGQAKVGRLADAEFDFMKKEVTAKDLSGCVPSAMTDYDVFPTHTPEPSLAPSPHDDDPEYDEFMSCW